MSMLLSYEKNTYKNSYDDDVILIDTLKDGKRNLTVYHKTFKDKLLSLSSQETTSGTHLTIKLFDDIHYYLSDDHTERHSSITNAMIETMGKALEILKAKEMEVVINTDSITQRNPEALAKRMTNFLNGPMLLDASNLMFLFSEEKIYNSSYDGDIILIDEMKKDKQSVHVHHEDNKSDLLLFHKRTRNDKTNLFVELSDEIENYLDEKLAEEDPGIANTMTQAVREAMKILDANGMDIVISTNNLRNKDLPMQLNQFLRGTMCLNQKIEIQ